MKKKKSAMINLFLKRKYKLEATIGRIETAEGQPIVETLERKENNNLRDDPNSLQNESACIPEGTYVCKWTRSNRFSNIKKKKLGDQYTEERDAVYTYELIDVKDRAGIRIHSANWTHQLHGCIAPATVIIDMNPKGVESIGGDNKCYASQSRDAHAKLIAFTKKQDFMLTIVKHS